MTGLLLLAVGTIAGGYGTIVGAGGGFIFVPALLYFVSYGSCISGYHTGFTLSIGVLPGSLLGVWLRQIYSSSYFYVIIATILVALGLFLFANNSPLANFFKEKAHLLGREGRSEEVKQIPTTPTTIEKNARLQIKYILPIGFLMGVLSSYLGIGGGWLLVPILIYAFKLPTHTATATSIFSLTLYCTVGVISQMFYSNIVWATVLWGGLGVIIGSQIGVLLSKKIPEKVVLQMLSVLLIVIGFRMYLN